MHTEGSLAPRDRYDHYGTGTLFDDQLHIFALDPICCFSVLDASLDSSSGVLAGERCFGSVTWADPPTYTKEACWGFTLTYDPTCE